jgi:hypothetical protein
MNRTFGEAKEKLFWEFFENFIVPLGENIKNSDIENLFFEWISGRKKKIKDSFEYFWLVDGWLALFLEFKKRVQKILGDNTNYGNCS